MIDVLEQLRKRNFISLRLALYLLLHAVSRDHVGIMYLIELAFPPGVFLTQPVKP